MGNYKLRVRTVNHKCTSSDGEWDGTWHTSYEWVIKDEEGIEVAGWDGYRTEEAARKAGEEMGLGKPWEPDWDDDEWPDMYYISWSGKYLDKEKGYPCCNMILIFPTEEMRDAFYENFKELIEQCKELL